VLSGWMVGIIVDPSCGEMFIENGTLIDNAMWSRFSLPKAVRTCGAEINLSR